MTSIQFRPHDADQFTPFLDQAFDLERLTRMLLSDTFENGNLLVEKLHRRDVGKVATLDHRHVDANGLSAQDDALIGFTRCHGGMMPEGFATW